MGLNQLPVLYSFRRCPYAIRARLALFNSGLQCELREVVLKSKPPALLQVSPKATVPILLPNGEAESPIEQSIEIVEWALNQSDPANWLYHSCNHELIQECDGQFKHWLDRYKYADRFPEHSADFYFEQTCQFLQKIEALLVPVEHQKKLNEQDQNPLMFCIGSAKVSVLDTAIFPFVRQCAFVDKDAFDQLEMPKLHAWLDYFLGSELFASVMSKYPMWIESESEQLVFGKSIA